jgi:hypothetical protein
VGSGHQREKREGSVPLQKRVVLGRGLDLVMGRIGASCPFHFFCSFSFSFSDFLFLLYLLQKGTKSIQTNF